MDEQTSVAAGEPHIGYSEDCEACLALGFACTAERPECCGDPDDCDEDCGAA